MDSYASYGLNAFLLTVLLIGWLKSVATQLDLVDRPDARKLHEGVIPLCGGVAIFLSLLLANAIVGFDSGLSLSAIAGLSIVAASGLADDRWDLPALPRLGAQVLAAIVLISFGHDGAINIASSLPAFLAPLAITIAPVVAIVFVVGTINAVNMMDGIDGLAGGTLAVVFFWLAMFAAYVGRPDIVLQAFLFVCALVGFLGFNLRHQWRKRASVYLGDAGSTMLGAGAAYFMIVMSAGSGVALPTLLWLIVVPVADTLLLIVHRLRAGRSPFSADRRHLHHLLLDMGFPQGGTAAILIGATALLGGCGYLGLVLGVPDPIMLLGLAIPLAAQAAFVESRARSTSGGRPRGEFRQTRAAKPVRR